LSDKLTFEKLRRFEPFLSSMSQYDLSSIAEVMTEQGYVVWRKKHIDPLLNPDYRARYAPELDDNFRALDQALSSRIVPYYWIERFPERGQTFGDAIEIVRQWSQTREGTQSNELYVNSVLNYGTRSDLDKLRSSTAWLELGEGAKAQVTFTVKRRSLN